MSSNRRSSGASALYLSAIVSAVLAAGFAPALATPPPAFPWIAHGVLSPDTTPRSLAAAQSMVRLPGGSYRLGDDAGPRSQKPAHHVTLAPFRIDRTEVTNAAFAEFLNALGLSLRGSFAPGRISEANADPEIYDLLREGGEWSGTYPLIALDDAQARIGFSDGRFAAEEGYAMHPVTETTWAGARAYCRWRGARLPSEAEWEAAARGTEARKYPWGEAAPDETRAFVSARTGATAPVGSRPKGATPQGLLDMAGSLAEWTSSLKLRYPYEAGDGREDPALAGERVTRGGDYIFDAEADRLTATHRNGFSNAPERGHRHIGFRCAADVSAN